MALPAKSRALRASLVFSVSLWLTYVILILLELSGGYRVAGPCTADSRSSQHRHSAAHRLDSRDDGGRQRTPDDLRVGGRHRSRRCFSRRCDSTRVHPRHAHNDRFVLSKGHAAPILYAAWSAVGLVPPAELLKLRELGNDLEGHPTPRLPFVDVATGSLGQGLAAGLGIALNATRIKSDYRTYVLMGDGETAEGSVWEAAESATHFGIDNLVAITDVNRLGQSRPTIWQHDLGALARRWSGFGWHTRADRRPRPGRDPRRAGRGPRHQGPSDDDPGQDVQGPGRVVCRGQGRLARQGVQGRRGGRPRRAGARIDVEAGGAGCDCGAARVDSEAHRRGSRRPSRARSSRRRPTSSATWSRRARPTARRWRASARSTTASSRSTPMWATRPSASGSRRSCPSGSSSTTSPNR